LRRCGFIGTGGGGRPGRADPDSRSRRGGRRRSRRTGVAAFTAAEDEAVEIATAVAQGESVEIATVGVYELPKLASAVIAAGARVAWDATENRIDLPGTGLYPVGIATEAAGDGVTTVRVRLDGVATQVA
jgi:predicted RecA/RadA family phage recombinase